MKRILASIIVLFVIVGCSPAWPLIQDTREATPSPTWTAWVVDAPTVTPEPTKVCEDIKGNISLTDGRHLYFTKKSINYANVKIDEALGERMFCSVEEAEAAGWTAAGK